jgi:GH35 family endo-1,4-beta-xylanase
MTSRALRRLAALLFPLVSALHAGAQTTTTNGSALALRSTGTVVNATAVRLQQNGYVGTYVTLAAPGSITLSVNAAGQAGGGVAPRMNVVVGDARYGFDVGASAASYATPAISLPAGTHFIRTEFANDVAAVDRRLTVNSLAVSGPATVANSHSDANALAAADTYIANYRKGAATVSLPGVAPGTAVQVQLVDHAFKFGAAVPGTSTSSVNNYLGNNPAPGSTAAHFQQRLLQNFNSITPENAGKWVNNQSTQTSSPTMGGVDRMMQFAQANDLRVRMHNLVWGQQQPTFVNNLLTAAASGDAAAKAQLSSEVTKRIGYYVRDRAPGGYAQLDVYNESVHEPAYWNVYGAGGIADIYNQTRDAVANPAARPTLFTNEYNVFQDSTDAYANWYRQNVEAIREAGGAVGGVGVQYYPHNELGAANDQHSAARMYGVMQNLSVAALPIELTEFGIKADGVGTTAQNQQRAADILESSLRLTFGTPEATGFTMWGFWEGAVWSGAPDGVLYNSDWSARPAGTRWEDLMTFDNDGIDDDWTTNLALVTGSDGSIDFTGFYGDYLITIDGKSYPLSLEKGTTSYTVNVPEPSAAALFTLCALPLLRRTHHTRS